MAIKSYSFVPTGRESEGVSLVKWTGLQETDTGAPFVFPRHTDRSVQVKGVFGVGGACVIEADLEHPATSYCTLNDPQGNALSFTAEKIESVLENATAIRPRVSAGDGDTLLDVYLLVSK